MTLPLKANNMQDYHMNSITNWLCWLCWIVNYAYCHITKCNALQNNLNVLTLSRLLNVTQSWYDCNYLVQSLFYLRNAYQCLTRDMMMLTQLFEYRGLEIWNFSMNNNGLLETVMTIWKCGSCQLEHRFHYYLNQLLWNSNSLNMQSALL